MLKLFKLMAVVAPVSVAFMSCRTSPNSNDNSTLIINGTRSDSTSSVVKVVLKPDGADEEFCSGVLVDPRTVVTAAHCLRKKTNKRGVLETIKPTIISQTKIGTEIRTNYIAVAKIFAYDLSDTGGKIAEDQVPYDIAILTLNCTADLCEKNHQNIASLSSGSNVLNRGAAVSIAGYGSTSETASAFGELYFGSSRVSEINESIIILPEREDNLAYTSQGDSGGPLFNDKNELIGIASATHKAAKKSYFARFSGPAWDSLWSEYQYKSKGTRSQGYLFKTPVSKGEKVLDVNFFFLKMFALRALSAVASGGVSQNQILQSAAVAGQTISFFGPFGGIFIGSGPLADPVEIKPEVPPTTSVRPPIVSRPKGQSNAEIKAPTTSVSATGSQTEVSSPGTFIQIGQNSPLCIVVPFFISCPVR